MTDGPDGVEDSLDVQTLIDRPREVTLPLTRQGLVRLPRRLRETYLTPAVADGTCLAQAAGGVVRVWIGSAREDIRLDLPVDGFHARRPYEQSIHRWGVNVSRYLNPQPVSAAVGCDPLAVDRENDAGPAGAVHAEVAVVADLPAEVTGGGR